MNELPKIRTLLAIGVSHVCSYPTTKPNRAVYCIGVGALLCRVFVASREAMIICCQGGASILLLVRYIPGNRGLHVSWNNGPLQSWYDIHEAIRNDLRHVRAMAVDPTADTGASLTGAVQFFLDVLTVHSMHEDGVAFPFMQRRGIEIPKRIREDHVREWSTVYDVRVTLMEIHALDEGRDADSAYKRIRTGLEMLEKDLLAHIEFEDGELIPQCEARLTIDEQKVLVTKLVGETPAWIAPHLMPWMFSNIPLEHAAHLLEAWRSVLPHATFLEKANAIRQGVEAPVWTALRHAVPILSELD